MDFRYNDKSRQLLEQVRAFMKEHIYPIEEDVYDFNHDPKNLSMLLASEAGELLAEFRWITSQESDALFGTTRSV